MKENFRNKTLLIGILILFFGASVVSAINNNIESTDTFNEIENFKIEIEKFYPADDSEIAQDQPNTIQGDNPSIIIRNEYGIGGSSGWASQGLVKFDISSLPKNAIIQSATIYLFYNKWTSTNPAGRLLDIHRITSDWSEDMVTWSNQPTHHSTPTDNSPVPGSINTWMDWDVTSDVQDFVSQQENNYGWIIIDDNYWGMPEIPLTQVRSKEYSQEQSPYLEIEYVNPHMAFLFGRIENLNTESGLTTFDSVRLRYLQFTPFSFNTYISGEKIAVANQILGIVTTNFAIGFFSSAALL